MRILFIILPILSCLLTAKNIHYSGDGIGIEEIIVSNKLKWGIDSFNKRNEHYFDLKINNCFKELIKNIALEPITYHLMQKEYYICIIEEIKFKDEKSLDDAYTILYQEAEKVRKGPRNKFGDVCFELREAQFFYAVKKGNCLYLISDANYYNYRYKGGDDSVDAIIQRDQSDKNEIVYDDIARFIQQY
jgi:hypothetical protein